MNLKKAFFAAVFVLLVSVAGFSQTDDVKNVGGYGISASYSPFRPSSWSVGAIAEFTFVRAGMSVGAMTVFYEKENPYSSKREMTEYWQRSLYIDFYAGGLYQKVLANKFALRLGGDIIFSMSPAYEDQHRTYGNSALEIFNWAFTGLAGIKLFPKEKYFINIDVCPGYATLISAMDLKGAFIMPIRLSAGFNVLN